MYGFAQHDLIALLAKLIVLPDNSTVSSVKRRELDSTATAVFITAQHSD